MKKKLFLMAMLGVMLVFGLVIAGCGDGNSGGSGGGGGSTNTNSITITGITVLTGRAGVVVATSYSKDVALGGGTIANGTLTVALRTEDGTDWTGNGDYLVMIENRDKGYIYTNGKTLSELGISSQADFDKLPKLSINSASTSVAFNKFVSFIGVL